MGISTIHLVFLVLFINQIFGAIIVVTVDDNGFVPNYVKAPAGSTIIWKNGSQNKWHSAVCLGGWFASGGIPPQGFYSKTLTSVGTYSYVDRFSNNQLQGSVKIYEEVAHTTGKHVITTGELEYTTGTTGEQLLSTEETITDTLHTTLPAEINSSDTTTALAIILSIIAFIVTFVLGALIFVWWKWKKATKQHQLFEERAPLMRKEFPRD